MKLLKKILKGILIGGAVIVGLFVAAVIYFMIADSKPTTSSTPVETTETLIDVDTSNEKTAYNDSYQKVSLNYTYASYQKIKSFLDNFKSDFSYASYYGLDEALALYHSTSSKPSSSSELLDENGKLDAKKLLAKVQKNNTEYLSGGTDAINVFYTEMDVSTMSAICDKICEVVNSGVMAVDLKEMSATLSELTMFEKTSAASNAYVTNDLTFVFNPTMTELYASMQSISGRDEDSQMSVVVHEIMHLLQYHSTDGNSDNGIEAGFCRMYNVPNHDEQLIVDTLWCPWVLEASAELGMASYLDVEPGIYAKKISYLHSYQLSHFNDFDLENQGLIQVAFEDCLENVYQSLNLSSQHDQQQFLEFLYSVEITQTDPEDFWENYTLMTNETPTDEQQLLIRKEIRKEVVMYLTSLFYENLNDALYQGNIQDLDTAFYLMRLWELDCFNHLQYREQSNLEPVTDFISYHHDLQHQLFEVLASATGKTKEDVQKAYQDYYLQAQSEDGLIAHGDFSHFPSENQSFILGLIDDYSQSNFCRNEAVYNYLQ